MGKKNNYNNENNIAYKNKILVNKIKKLEREIKKLKSEKKTLQNMWQKTENYLTAISENKSIKEIFNEIDTKTDLRKIRKKCPNSNWAVDQIK